MSDKEKTFLIIDSHALIHRAYHALPEMRSPSGQPTNAVYGFTSVLIKVLRELKPDYVVAAFDLAGPTFRHEAYEEYKGTRQETDDNLVKQFPYVRQILKAFKIPILEHESFEADDIIGTVVERLRKEKDIKIIIVTGDLDTLQVVEKDRVVVYTLKKGVTDTVIYNEEKVKERFEGLLPNQLTDFKGLKGDPSDNIPGVPGVGEKTAIRLLKKHKSIKNLYENIDKDKEVKGSLKEKLENNKDQAFFSKELATIRNDVPVAFSLKKARYIFSENSEIKEVLSSFGFKSLIRRIESKDKEKKEESGQERFLEDEKQDELSDLYKKKIFSKKIYEIELALTPVLKKMEDTGFLIDVEILKKLGNQTNDELAEIKKKVFKISKTEFNLNSPQEVAYIVFEKLGLGGSRLKRTKTGLISTAAAELEKIKDEHEIVPLLLKWRELSKLKSTYLDALPRLINPRDGRIHTTFKQFGAVTGRLASENPNLQNIPVKGKTGSEIRKAFVAPKGHVLVSADYSQIELRIAASLSGDKKMIDAFKKGEDIHARTAAEVFNTPIDKVTKDMRREAKILNFGILYGMGVRSFSKSAGTSQDGARKFIDEYKSDFDGLTKFIKQMKAKAYAQGYIETFWGRRRLLPELSSGNPGMRAAGERMAVNMPVQGTAADVIKTAMVQINNRFNLDDNIKMILQVHDELVFEIKENTEDKYIPIIKEIMENVINLSVPLLVDVEIGPSWGEMKKIKN